HDVARPRRAQRRQLRFRDTCGRTSAAPRRVEARPGATMAAAKKSTRKSTKKSTATSRRATTTHKVAKDAQGLPRVIFAQASPRSVGGRSMFEMGSVTADSAQSVMSEPEVVLGAASQLQQAGFTVHQVSSTTINISGPADLYRRAFE